MEFVDWILQENYEKWVPRESKAIQSIHFIFMQILDLQTLTAYNT